MRGFVDDLHMLSGTMFDMSSWCGVFPSGLAVVHTLSYI